MSHFDTVTATFSELKYMQPAQAEFIREFVVTHEIRDILEIGFYHGKGSAYMAAILEDLGRGHLVTIDKETSRNREPDINSVLGSLGLAHRVTPIFSHRSYTWELGKMIREQPRPQFDLCYFDGGHTWDATGFGFLLVDMLLRPGGWIIFDDLQWTIDAAVKNRRRVPSSWSRCSADERATPGVKLVFDTIVPHLGYTERRTARDGLWGIARKPVSDPQPNKRTLGRILDAISRKES